MDIKSLANSIINQHMANRVNCRGLNECCHRWATTLAKIRFEQDGVDFDGWNVNEIPLAERPNEEYTNGVVICLQNDSLRKAIDIVYDNESGKLLVDIVKITGSIQMNSIQDAIASEHSSFNEPEYI